METKNLSNHFLTTTILSIILIILTSESRLTFISKTTISVLSPVSNLFTSLRYNFNQKLAVLNQIPHQQRIIEDLKRQNRELALLSQNHQDLISENQKLKQALNLTSLPDYQLVLAKVIGVSRYATLDHGSTSFIQPNLAVTANETLLGVISETLDSTSKVRLLNDKDTDIKVRTVDNKSAKLVFENNLLLLTNLPQKETLKVEDVIFTEGDEFIPPGLLVGTVKIIISDDSDLFIRAEITPADSITNHRHVTVIRR